ncbi:MAG: hypothetical protein AVDCRST_MAG12-3591, partial [uncultured Rubrobacteraceae bacterium]
GNHDQQALGRDHRGARVVLDVPDRVRRDPRRRALWRRGLLRGQVPRRGDRPGGHPREGTGPPV